MSVAREAPAAKSGFRQLDRFTVVHGERERDWAAWVVEQLQRAGYAAGLLQHDFASGTARELFGDIGGPLYFVFAESYPEFNGGFWNEKGKMALAIGVRPLDRKLFGPYLLDLVGEAEETARDRLLERANSAGVTSLSGAHAEGDGAPYPGGKPLFNFRPRAVSDIPADEDVIGFEPLVEGLYALLNDEQTSLPLAVAVTAPWGAGKSSVMRQLHRRLLEPPRAGETRHREWYTVTFEAWKYERGERLWAALAKAIYAQPQRQMSRRGRTWFRIRLEASRQSWPRFLLRGLLAPTVLTAFAVVGLLKQQDAAAALFGGTLTGVLSIVASTGTAWGAVTDPFKRAIESFASRPRYEQQHGFTSDADRQVSELTSALTRDGHALAVFVDDLDRCSPRSLVDVVEAINQIFNSVAARPCVFVLGMDREVVSSAIDVAYKETVEYLEKRGSPLARTFGISFLAKIVQVSVTVPPPSKTGMENLLAQVTGKERPVPHHAAAHAVESVAAMLRAHGLENPQDVAPAAELLENLTEEQRHAIPVAVKRVRGALLNADAPHVAEVEEELLELLEPNPRQIKRFDNAFRLQLRVASDARPELHFDRDELYALGKWVALRLRWPDLAQAIDANPVLLADLEELANGGEADGGAEEWFVGRGSLKELLAGPESRRLARVHETFLQIA